MSNIPADLKYTKEHEWASIKGDVATVGITDFAQHELGDIVFIQLPEVGATFKEGEAFGEIEAVKTVASLFSPVSGTVTEVNAALGSAADSINKDPYTNGWIIRMKLSDPSETANLLTAEQYQGIL